MRVRPVQPSDLGALARMRHALWPEQSAAAHAAELQTFLADARWINLAAELDGAVIGFADAAIRSDYVNGCDTSPVAFLEGLFVAPEHRRQGVGRALVAAVAAWGRESGCREMASDAYLDNLTSHALHKAVGFEETERVVYFRRSL